MEKDTVTLNEKQGEVHPRRKDKTPNGTWVAFGVRSVVAWGHLKRSSHDKLWRALLLSSLRPAVGWLHGEVDALDFRPAQESDCCDCWLLRDACFDGHRWRLACGTSLPVAVDVAEDVMSAREAREERV